MIVYKVVKKNRKTLSSIVVTKKARVIYEVGKKAVAPKWLREKGYHIVAFDSIDHAYDFARHFPHYQIMKCEVEVGDIVSEKPHTCHIKHLNAGFVLSTRIPYWPDGTIMCESLTPLEVL